MIGERAETKPGPKGRDVQPIASRTTREDLPMSVTLNRRTFLAGTALAASGLARPAIAQGAPFKIGLLTVKTGPLAQGGNQMEQGIVSLLKEKNYTLAGRKVELIVADTGGKPDGTRNKLHEV